MIVEYSPENLELASDLISRGEAVAFPVEHGYAIACEPFNSVAVERLQAARGAHGTALPLFIGYRTALDGVATGIDPAVRQLLMGAWPGLLTLVATSAVPWNLGDGGSGVISVRQPIEPIALALAQLHGPIAATSAAIAGGKSQSAHDVQTQLAPALIIDGGSRPDGPPSTVVRCQGATIEIVRIGAVSVDEIKRLAPDLTIAATDGLG